MNNAPLILSIESAVAGGSLALLRGTETLAYRSEGNDSSRAEKVLAAIDELLKQSNVVLRDLDAIAVSIGPGSYSGIRIGVSTAIGLSNAIGVVCLGVSVLDAIAHMHVGDRDLIAAVPVGKNDVAWQRYSRRKTLSDPELLPCSAFVELLTRHTGTDLLAHAELLERLDGNTPVSINLRSVGPGIAEYVGRLAQVEGRSHTSLRPLYLRNSRAPRSAAF